MDSVNEVRTKIVQKFEDPSSSVSYDERDLKLVKLDWFLQSFVNQVIDKDLKVDPKSIDKILINLDKALKWRKQFAINDMSFVDLPREIYDQQIAYCYELDTKFYTFLIFRNLKTPSGFTDSYHKLFVLLSENLLKNRDKYTEVIGINDFSQIGITNFNLTLLMKVSLLVP